MVVHDGYIELESNNIMPLKVEQTGGGNFKSEFIKSNDLGNTTLDFYHKLSSTSNELQRSDRVPLQHLAFVK